MESIAEEGASLGAPAAGARLANGDGGAHGAASADVAAGPHSPVTNGGRMQGGEAGVAAGDVGVQGGVPGLARDPALADMDIDRGPRQAQSREDLRCAAQSCCCSHTAQLALCLAIKRCLRLQLNCEACGALGGAVLPPCAVVYVFEVVSLSCWCRHGS